MIGPEEKQSQSFLRTTANATVYPAPRLPAHTPAAWHHSASLYPCHHFGLAQIDMPGILVRASGPARLRALQTGAPNPGSILVAGFEMPAGCVAKLNAWPNCTGVTGLILGCPPLGIAGVICRTMGNILPSGRASRQFARSRSGRSGDSITSRSFQSFRPLRPLR